MNSNSRSSNSQAGSKSFNNYEFDFGLTSNSRSSGTSLNAQRYVQQTPSYSSPSQPQPTLSRPVSSSSWNPTKTSWTHNPSPSQAPRSSTSNPTSMVGDIFGKSWTSTTPSSQNARPSVSESNPQLFSDLLGTALGQSKDANTPLKNAGAPAPPRPNSFGMRGMADSIPKAGNSSGQNNIWGKLADSTGNFSSGGPTSGIGSANLWGPATKTGSAPVNSKKDPFGSLVDFGSKPSPLPVNKNDSSSGNSFGAFQSAPKHVEAVPAYTSNPSPPINNFTSSDSSAFFEMNEFGGFPSAQAPQPKSADPLDVLFSSSASAPSASTNQNTSEEFAGADDWGFESGAHDSVGTTDLEGLPPPPAGVTAITAKTKGMDNYKQGQFADAIKWLSWATILLEKSGNIATNFEVLSCRASCYKEVGEYKKAIADCTKVLESDCKNVSVLLQRALLYESSEKYKLGAEDLRAVLKIDPSNRLAKGTIHRLTKLAD
ncbi:cell wall protein RBR3-like [Aristolochia californica]|uniref:cell wall protein RBR3-like n=1 Tax=Aristolochia californica TaxID=171875 RepID=UPI0035D808B5